MMSLVLCSILFAQVFEYSQINLIKHICIDCYIQISKFNIPYVKSS
jgi:hypothetical protein